MRPAPARILFVLLAAVSGALAALTGQLIFVIVVAMAALLLASSLATSHVPVTRRLAAFRGRSVEVRFCGAPPAEEHLVLASVNIISVGVHVFFTEPSGRLLHLKIAQPSQVTISPDRVVISAAKYVQWQGKKVKSIPGSDAVSIASTLPAPTASGERLA
jgi:hypothetical protein